MFINIAGTSGKKVMSKLDSTLFFVHNEMFHMSNISTCRTSYGTVEEQTTKVTQLLDGLEERVESLFEESVPLKLKGAIERAFVDVRFKYYGSDATIKERVRGLEEKREEKRKADLAIKEAKRLKRMRVQEEKQKAELAVKEEKRQKRKRAQEEKWKAELEKAELAIKEAKRLKRMRVQEEKQKAELAVKEERQKGKRAQEEKWKAEREKWKAERAIKEAQRMRALEEKWISTEEECLKRIATGHRNTSSAGNDFPSGWIVKTYLSASREWVGRSTRYWFSPGRNIRFRTKKHVMTFIDILKESSVEGDEDKAAEVYKARGHKFC
eukprot:g4957.t1 g4957   contig18:316959-317933(-)